jgi:hypothetical protein
MSPTVICPGDSESAAVYPTEGGPRCLCVGVPLCLIVPFSARSVLYQKKTGEKFLLELLAILSYHLGPGRPSGLFPSGFPAKTLYASLALSAMRAACPALLFYPP